MLFTGEQEAIKQVLEAGRIYGYGNMIAHLKTAWAKHLMGQGISKDFALAATNASAYPIEEIQQADQADG